MTFDLGLFKRQRYTPPTINSFGSTTLTTSEILSTNNVQYAVHVFTSSGVFTLPAYVSTVTAQVFVVGGGGGGGGNNGGGGGGGGGVINSSTYILSPGFPYVVTIGSGGTIGVNAGIPGGIGGSSSIYNSDLSNSGYFGGSSYLQLGTTASTAVNALANQKYVTIESWLNTQTIQYVDNDPYWSSVNFLIDADTGSLVDRKGTYTLSAIGTTAVNTSTKKFGAGSAAILGGGNVASLQVIASNFNIAGAFTLDGWVYLTAGGRHALLGTPNGQAYNTEWGFGIFDTLGAYGAATAIKGLCFMLSPANGYGGNFLYTGQYPPLNTWTHFAFQRDASNNWSIYMNGVKGTLQNDNANAHSYSAFPANNGPAGSISVYGLIGNWDGFVTGGNGSQFAAGFNGYLDDFRLTIGVARYSDNTFALPTASAYTLSQNVYFDDNAIFGQAPASGNGRYAIKLKGTYDQTIVFLWSDSGSTTQQVVTTKTLTQKTWNHIAITLDMTNPSSTTIKIYINGIAETFTGNNLSSHTVDNGNPSYIGGIYGNAAYNFNGYLSNFRFSKGSLLTYTGNFTPPTSKLTAPQIVLPYGISFSGTTQYLTGPALASNQLTGDFTIECWINPTSVPAYTGIITITNISSSGANGCAIFITTTNAVGFFIAGNTNYSSANNILTPNQWQHIALVRLGTTNTLYLNGVSVVTNTVTPTWPATPTISVGRLYADNSLYSFPGIISNVRITKGVAVYTGAFTPPTTTLTTTQSAGTNIAAISTASYVALLTAQSNTIVDNSTYAQTLTPTGSPAVVSTLTLYSTTLLTLNDVTFIDKSVNNYPLTLSSTPPTIATSYIFALFAAGGGGAGSGDSSGINYIGGNGGSGGGGATTGGTVGAGGTGIAGLGFAGGRGATDTSTYRSGGGGGGAGSTGTAAVSSAVAGAGGTGTFTTMLSTTTAIIFKVGQYVTATNAIYFAGGGAGGPFSGSSSIAGLGGGGLQKASGTINTGGGGGGAGSAGTVGSGGSGIVIIRYPVPGGISAVDNTPTDPYFKNTSLLLTGAVLNKSIPTQWLVDYLVVGGGGGGGRGATNNNDYAGGGGAGGLVTTSTRIAADNDTYTIQVGAGGLAGALNSNGTNGSNSFITSSTVAIVALGGGYGATRYIDGGSGGSGGGAGVYISYTPSNSQAGGVATQPSSASGGFGFGGGTGFNYNWAQSGGGGGAGGAGGVAGGDGKYLANFSSFGESGYFASGGAGVIGGIGGDSAFKLGGGGGFATNAQYGGSSTVPRSAITGTGGGGAIGMPGADGTVIFRHSTDYGTATVTGNPLTTSTGGYTYYKWSTSGTIRFTPQQLILSNNNVFVDSSANALTITPTGTPTQGTFSPFGQNWSNFFNGTTDYLSFAKSTNLEPVANQPFTIETWFYATTVANQTLYTYATAAGGGSDTAFYIILASNSTIGAGFYTGGAAQNITAPATAYTINQWYHMALCSNGTTMRFFINGVSLGTPVTVTGLAPNTGAYTGRIGYYRTSEPFYFNGYISNFRFIKGTALYTSNFTPATAPLTAVTNTVLLTAASNNYIDKSGVNTITTVGSPRVIRFSPFTQDYAYNSIIHSGSTYFNGSSQYLQAQSTTAGDFGTGDFTVEFWMNATAAGTFVAVVGTQSIAGSGTAGMWRISNRLNSANGIYFNYTTGSTFVDLTFSTTNYNDGAWHHVAACRALGTLRMFVDGVLVGSPTAVSQSLTSGQRINIGYQPQDGAYYTGYVSNLRVVKGVAAYTMNFTPLSTPVMSVQTYFRPAGMVVPPAVTAYAWGAGGGGGNVGGWSYGAAAGAGGAAEGIIAVTSNTTYYVTVGGSGKVNPSTTGAIGGGGSMLNTTDNTYGGGGGGYSAIFNSASASQGTTILMAGGGGGGGSSRAGTGNVGGAGGGTSGQAGTSAYDGNAAYAGVAGGQTVATAGTGGTAGTALQGGTPGTNSYGGGGGGGYWGGGGGGYAEPNTMAGGGGGSGYFNASVVTSAVLTAGSGVTPGNSASALRGTAGVGGAVATAGSSGTVVIRYAETYSPIVTTGNPAVSVSGGFRNYTWTASGSFTMSSTYPDTVAIESTQTSLLLNGNNIGIIDSTMQNNINLVGNAAFSKDVVKYNARSIYINGTSNYVTGASNPALSFSGNFTVEMWLYLTAIPTGSPELFNAGNFHLNFRSGPNIAITNDASVLSNLSNTIFAGVWTHVAAVRSSGIMTIYLNGFANIPSSSQTYSFTQSGWNIGSGSSGFVGYIDDLRVTRDIARYTTNFIPPQASPKLK